MNCGYSKTILALYVGDDLPTAGAMTKVELHVAGCAHCREYCDELRKNQCLIQSRFRTPHQEPVHQSALAAVRRNVMSQIATAERSVGWATKVERFLFLGLRGHKFAAASFAVLVIVSASLLGQIAHSGQHASGIAVFIGKTTLELPADYRKWVFAGSSLGHEREEQSSGIYRNVYINPSAYREYIRSGAFPDGTIMVLEGSSALEVSVKDSGRFNGSWGFYEFTESAGKLEPQAEVLPATAACLSCHREKAATDHVFTQYYPALRGIGSRRAI